jgi:hypothetical protein
MLPEAVLEHRSYEQLSQTSTRQTSDHHVLPGLPWREHQRAQEAVCSRERRQGAGGPLGEEEMSETPLQSIQQRFTEFHAANPHIYFAIVAKARKAVSKGYNKIGIGFLVEICRWEDGGSTISRDGFKISNDFRSRYSRLIEQQEPDLKGFFTKRQLESY